MRARAGPPRGLGPKFQTWLTYPLGGPVGRSCFKALQPQKIKRGWGYLRTFIEAVKYKIKMFIHKTNLNKYSVFIKVKT